MSDSVICDIEHGRLDRVSLPTLTRVIEALDARLIMDVRWRGGELDRLLDADHASLMNAWQRRLEEAGWLARSEVSFNHYGDRRRIDNLAFDLRTRTLLVTEGKTGIFDEQSLIGSMDVKERVALREAQRFGWRASTFVSCLVVAEGRTNRRRFNEHAHLFARLDCRGRSASAWLTKPHRAVGGLLVILPLPESGQAGRRRAGRQRIRVRGRDSSVNPRH